jgi:hypothetical protein
MPRPSRATNIQVPGETADAAQAKAPASTESQPQALKAEPEAKLLRPSRAQYAQMSAADVDVSTLKTAVLTKDGWLCPPTLTNKV